MWYVYSCWWQRIHAQGFRAYAVTSKYALEMGDAHTHHPRVQAAWVPLVFHVAETLKYDVETFQPFHTTSMSQAIQLGDLESGTLFTTPPCSYRSNPMYRTCPSRTASFRVSLKPEPPKRLSS